MINPNKNYYMGIMTRLQFSTDNIEDIQDVAFKIAVGQPIHVWARWSITLDKFVVVKVKRANKPTAKTVEYMATKALKKGLRFRYLEDLNRFYINGSDLCFESAFRRVILE